MTVKFDAFVFLTLFFTRERINVAAMMEFVGLCCIRPLMYVQPPQEESAETRALQTTRFCFCDFKNGRDIVFQQPIVC